MIEFIKQFYKNNEEKKMARACTNEGTIQSIKFDHSLSSDVAKPQAKGTFQARSVEVTPRAKVAPHSQGTMTTAMAKAALMQRFAGMDKKGPQSFESSLAASHIKDEYDFSPDGNTYTPKEGSSGIYDDYVATKHQHWKQDEQFKNTPIIAKLESSMNVQFTNSERIQILSSLS
jgi:hypothetical protein